MRHSTTGRWFARASALLLAAAAAVFVLHAPAQAALPDRLGMVLYNGAAPMPSGTWPPATTVVPGPPGRYTITFPGQGTPGGVVHVTAINATPHWCQADSWTQVGADEVVKVACYKVGGLLDPSAFAALFSRSSGAPTSSGKFGYVDALASGVTVSQYNSAGAVNLVTPIVMGQWEVRMPGLGTPGPVDGSVQATAVNDVSGARCKVASWSSTPGEQKVNVNCFNAFGMPINTRFTLTYQYQRSLYGGLNPPKHFGYLWNMPPVGGPTTNFNSQVGPGGNTLTPSGFGLSLVRFPSLTFLPDNVQVTAYGAGPNFCGLQSIWGHGPDIVVRNVNCFTSAGAATNSGFTISANSKL